MGTIWPVGNVRPDRAPVRDLAWRADWLRAARGGALAGVGVIVCDAYLFAVGAVTWTSLRLWSQMGSERWLFGLLVLNGAGWVARAVALAVIGSVLAVPLGSVTAVLLGRLANAHNRAAGPAKAAMIGIGLCSVIVVGALAVLQLALAPSPAGIAQAWVVWLGLPIILSMVGGGVGGWLANRHLKSSSKFSEGMPQKTLEPVK